MRIYVLFELFLVVFTLYAILKYKGSKAVLIPILCLGTVYLFEQMRKKTTKEVEKARKGPLKRRTPAVQVQQFERTGQPEQWDD
jgi:hypothetical protein